MAVENPTAANVSLWTHFLRKEFGLDARPTAASDYLSRAAAAAVSSWLTLAMAPRIGRMYRDNAPHVTGFGFTATDRGRAPSPVPPELRKGGAELQREANAPERRRHYERRSTSSAGTSSAATTNKEMATISH
jgi:hypothetical protein